MSQLFDLLDGDNLLFALEDRGVSLMVSASLKWMQRFMASLEHNWAVTLYYVQVEVHSKDNKKNRWKVLQEIENFHELPIGVKYQAIFQSHYICFTANVCC